jgi:hypothetical protein
MDSHIRINIYNTPPWMSTNNDMVLDAHIVASLKTLPGNKNPVGQK